MNTCPVCGFRNLESNTRCLKCRALLKATDEEIEDAFARADKKKESTAGLRFAGALETLLRNNPLRKLWRVPEGLRHRFPFTAGWLSLLPGLGQFYNHQVAKGLLLAGLWWFYAAVCVATITESYSNWMLLGLLLAWFYIWNDAVGTAIRINGQRWSLRNSLALFFGIMCISGIVISLNQIVLQNFVTAVHVFDDVHNPDINLHDLLIVNHMSYWFSNPKVGDVIYFDPDRFTGERGADLTSINIKDYFQRVVGVAGDKLERRGGKTYRNGKPIQPEEEAFGANLLPEGEMIEVPPGYVYAPITHFPSDIIGGLAVHLLGGFSPFSPDSGTVWIKWREACLVRIRDFGPEKEKQNQLLGRAVAITNPPERRRWF